MTAATMIHEWSITTLSFELELKRAAISQHLYRQLIRLVLRKEGIEHIPLRLKIRLFIDLGNLIASFQTGFCKIRPCIERCDHKFPLFVSQLKWKLFFRVKAKPLINCRLLDPGELGFEP